MNQKNMSPNMFQSKDAKPDAGLGLDLIDRHPHFQNLVAWLHAHPTSGQENINLETGEVTEVGKPAHRILQGLKGSSGNILFARLAAYTQRPLLVVKAHLDDVEAACLDWQCLGEKYESWIHRFPALEVLPGESHAHVELLAERLQLTSLLQERAQLNKTQSPLFMVSSIQALMQCVPVEESVREFTLPLTTEKDALSLRDVIAWLDHTGYERVDAVEQPGEFSVRGGIVDVLAVAGMYESRQKGAGQIASSPLAVRLDFFGDELDGISLFDATGMASIEALNSCRLLGAREEALQEAQKMEPFMNFLPADTLVILDEPLELAEQGRGYYHRLTDPRGIVSHNGVFEKLMRFNVLELHGYGAMLNSGSGKTHAPVKNRLTDDSPPKPAGDLPPKPAGLVPPKPAGLVPPKPAGLAPDIWEDLSWHVETIPPFEHELSKAIEALRHEIIQQTDTQYLLYCHSDAQVARLQELLTGESPDDEDGEAVLPNLAFGTGYLQQGFRLVVEGQTLSLIAAHELLGSSPTVTSRFQPTHIRRAMANMNDVRGLMQPDDQGEVNEQEAAIDAFFEIEEGDLVVHVDHGIGIFKGLSTLKRRGEQEEYLTLLFADDAVLHVPVSQMELIQKYIGGNKGNTKLSQMGGRRWKRQKQQVSESVKDLAAQMLRIQAAREAIPGIRFPADTVWQRQFEAEFPYQETEDQLAALVQIKKDMMSSKSMDRLLCGDVGFGKTEVAIRAAFKAADSGKQVAILVPTTVLAEQHLRTFKSRMASYPFRVECLNRFKTGKQQKHILEGLKQGRVDIIIGTHRLLSEDVHFNDLGLVVIDEEQRFGVEHKQRLLSFRMTADVLTLSATPIPRTLHMSLLGLRHISSLTTPPADRRAVVTDVISRDMSRVKQAIVRELNREGQVYFLHNRVNTIHAVANDIRTLVPDAKVIVGHGQMPARELEKVMLQFTRGEADVLVCTTIIESGVDIPKANTMMIDQSDYFGLAELHQLRGRVGRDRHRAYCYLLLPDNRPVTDKAIRRLRALESYAMLGAGFKIAMQDLEIRGAGNLLGAEQSGHISAVGYQMYCQLLAHEAMRLKNEPIIEPLRTHLELPLHGRIPATYIESSRKRMSMYRRFSRVNSFKHFERLQQTMVEAYGSLPQLVQDYMDLTELRIAASHWGIKRLRLEAPDLIYTMEDEAKLKALKKHLDHAPGRASHIESKVLYWRPPENYLSPIGTLMAVLRKLLLTPMTQS